MDILANSASQREVPRRRSGRGAWQGGVDYAPMTEMRTAGEEARRQRRAVRRFVVRVLAILTACWLIVGASVAPVLPGGAWTAAAAWALFTVVPLAVFIATRSLGWYPGALVRLLVFRPLWYAQLFILPLALAGGLGWLAGWPFAHAAGAGRASVLATGALVTALALAGYAGSRRLEVRRFVATWPDLPPAVEGLTVAQISDLHVGPQTSRRHLGRVVDAVLGERPDLIAVTGDLVDDFPGDAGRYAAGLGALAAPLGVFAVPGNHEVYSGWAALRPRLEALPLTLLVNRSVRLARNGGHFVVAGTGDPAAGRSGEVAPDIARTLADAPPGAFVLALAHNPALWPALAARGVGLTLSGHTHWGQLAFPRRGWSLAGPFLELAMGAHVRGGSVLYIHPGTNYWGIPFRLGHAAQVAIITMRAGEKAEWKDEGTDELPDGEAGRGSRTREAATR
jgi:predicted MPP superfamily phosphohydrolase